MKKGIAITLLIASLCACFSSCAAAQSPFIHSLKKGRYISQEVLTLEDLEITNFQMELTDGNMMEYVKTDGENMIKDIFTVKEKLQTVFGVNITMCINGETWPFHFESAAARNRNTQTEYQISGLAPVSRGTVHKFLEIDSLILKTLDTDGDGTAEKLEIQIGDQTFTAENKDIPHRFTLHDEKGIFGTKGKITTTHFDYQTVELYADQVTSANVVYRMPVITFSDGQVVKPVLEETQSGNKIYRRWILSFQMPSQDIIGTVSEIEVAF